MYNRTSNQWPLCKIIEFYFLRWDSKQDPFFFFFAKTTANPKDHKQKLETDQRQYSYENAQIYLIRKVGFRWSDCRRRNPGFGYSETFCFGADKSNERRRWVDILVGKYIFYLSVGLGFILVLCVGLAFRRLPVLLDLTDFLVFVGKMYSLLLD